MTRFAAVALTAVLAGCTNGGETRLSTPVATETSGTVRLEFRTEPSPPRSGDNSLEVVVRQPDGTPVTDASVEVVFTMPAMPSMNMPAMRTDTKLAHESGGRYTGIGRLSMGGTWNVVVTATRGAEELGSSRFSVIAK